MSVIEGLNLETNDFGDEDLFEIGLELLGEHCLEEAIQIGEALLEREYVGGFELVARGLAALQDFEQAVEVLQDGIEVDPKLWRLWELLACYQAELDAPEEARASFKKALELPGADASVIYLHWATVESNVENFAEARALAENVTDPEDADDRQLLMVRVNLCEGKVEEAYELGHELLRRDEGENPSWRAMAAATLGQVCLLLNKRDEALALAREACQLDECDACVLHLVRELDGRMAEGTPSVYAIIYKGTGELEGEKAGFLQRYEVTAGSEEEALAFAQAYMDLAGKSGLALNEITVEYQRGPTMAGVYDVSARHYFLNPDADAASSN